MGNLTLLTLDQDDELQIDSCHQCAQQWQPTWPHHKQKHTHTLTHTLFKCKARTPKIAAVQVSERVSDCVCVLRWCRVLVLVAIIISSLVCVRDYYNHDLCLHLHLNRPDQLRCKQKQLEYYLRNVMGCQLVFKLKVFSCLLFTFIIIIMKR